jgi:hypothetical protein
MTAGAEKKSVFRFFFANFSQIFIPEYYLKAYFQTLFMVTATYSIAFDFPLESTSHSIAVTADVEVHHSVTYYAVKNFRAGVKHDHVVLPDIAIKKLKGRWVHTDSEKETHLSVLVGNAIDHAEM